VAVVHFAGPPGQETLAEVAEPVDAAEAVLRRVEEWAASLGRLSIRCADRPGLVVLRVWLPALNEAALLLREGMLPARIEEAMARFGLSPGPLELMDRLGLDAVARLVEALQPALAGRLTLENGFAEMVRQGMLGARCGTGFYRYAGRQRRPNPRAVALWWAGPGDAWLSRTGLSRAEQMTLAQQRLSALMVIEACYCLAERVVADADTLDFALAATGWAPYRGGPITYARQLGVEVLVALLEQLAQDFGPRFNAPPGLGDVLTDV
jgi:3-hydroxyacyl-CoA dehydrogenase/enoyl-CoA hydratase/3-hydroxybutyryl-CoA epimerase